MKSQETLTIKENLFPTILYYILQLGIRSEMYGAVYVPYDKYSSNQTFQSSDCVCVGDTMRYGYE